MATRTLSPEKSAKLARALASVIDAMLNLHRTRAEVYAPEPSPLPTRMPAADQDRHGTAT